MQQIKWYHWKRVTNPVRKGEHIVKVALFRTLTAFYKKLVKQLPNFVKHVMLKRVQAEANKASQAKVGGEQGLLQVDFAENYNCLWQDEIQSAHWGKVIICVCRREPWITSVLIN